MTFITYTPFDAIGTAVGLNLLEKLTDGLWKGSFLGVGILSIFVFLSLAKIAMDSIIEHRYEKSILEFSRLLVVILLFTVSTTATIFNMSIINFGYAQQAAKNGSTLIGSAYSNWLFGSNDSEPSSAQIQVPSVPLMGDIYAISDNLAYQITNLMLNPQKSMTIDLSSLILDPKSILNDALDKMVLSSKDEVSVYKVFAKCYDHQAYEDFPDVNTADMSCQQFDQQWAAAAQNIVNQIQQQANLDPRVLEAMNNMIYLVQQGTLRYDKDLKSKYLGTELSQLDEVAKEVKAVSKTFTLTSTNSTIKGGGIVGDIVRNLDGLISSTLSGGGVLLSHALIPKQYLEYLMLHMQEYAIAIMFLLLPFVVVIGLLPIFGSNYKLILKYAISFFLIKLWIPILWFVYISMVDVSAVLVSGAGTSSGASTSQQIANAILFAEEANKYSDVNNLILASMYVIIPVVLGSSATYLVGKGMVDAAAVGFAEGALVMKKLGGMIIRAVTRDRQQQ